MIISIQHPGDETVLRLIVAHRELSVMGPGSHGIPSEPNRRQQLMQYMTKIIVLTVRIRICNKLPLLILFLLYFLSLSLPSYSHSSASPCSLSTSLSPSLSYSFCSSSTIFSSVSRSFCWFCSDYCSCFPAIPSHKYYRYQKTRPPKVTSIYMYSIVLRSMYPQLLVYFIRQSLPYTSLPPSFHPSVHTCTCFLFLSFVPQPMYACHFIAFSLSYQIASSSIYVWFLCLFLCLCLWICLCVSVYLSC